MPQPQQQQTFVPDLKTMQAQAAAQEPASVPSPEPSPSPTLNVPAEKVTTINMDDIRPNSVLIINIDVESAVQKMAVAPVFSKLLAPYASKLREKGVTVMLMTLHENINLISEEEMNAAGWEKKAKSLILNPFGR